MQSSSKIIKRIITGAILALGFSLVYLYAPVWAISVIFIFILVFILLFEWPLFNMSLLTPIYPVFPFILLIMLNQSEARSLIPILFIAVFGCDTGGYTFGKLMGRHKLWPKISPLKTWEGVLGGMAVSILCTITFCKIAGYSATLLTLFLVSCLLSLAGIAGDLFESYLKRRASLKDSGTSLPGHGGWLDRLDGILGAITILYPLRLVILAFLKN